ncbi:hypothetical protein FB45DRAFT_1112870 [Roridomyces roridus]|uniref:F-box domain-containing protein n=1 Tax=Roridomyces roridus TaxID=1738132 RepID=A0AAD7FE03_9AGAR|nr:hypothetical protein FB45DRAFT_1112870 [Roridomyces roridus]
MHPELAAARNRIAQVDIEIKELEHTLSMRLTERNQCRQVLARYKYPILTLPNEITSEIFLHSLPSHTEFVSLVGPDSPSSLLQICKQWRDVALGTPALWSSIHVDVNHNPPSVYERHLKLLELWLERSGTYPLSIRLWDMRSDEELASVDVPTTKFLDAILRHSSRWQEVDLTVPYELLRVVTTPMPVLRRVSVGPAERQMPLDTTPSATAVALFTSAPDLRTVLLHPTCNPFTITLPWSQITTLTAEGYVPEAIHMLHQTTALETCTLTIYCQEGSVSTLPIIPTLPLRSLSVLWGEGSLNADATDAVKLLTALTVPLLHTLVISELLLGSDPIAALSQLLPEGYPHKMHISQARRPSPVYRDAFPDAEVTFESSVESESESE